MVIVPQCLQKESPTSNIVGNKIIIVGNKIIIPINMGEVRKMKGM